MCPAPQPLPIPPLGAYVAKRCPLRVQLDLVKPGVPLEPTPDVQLRLDQGVAFEETIVSELRAVSPADWTFIDETKPFPAQIEDTIAAIRAGASVIVGSRLPDDETEARSGAPDLLVRDQGGYVPIDIKHHLTVDSGESSLLVSTLSAPLPAAATHLADSALRASKDDALQLAHYRRMLEARGWASADTVGGIIGKEQLVVWYELAEPMWTTPAKSGGRKRKRRSSLEAYDFEFEFRRDMAVEAVTGVELLPPVRISDCVSCGWVEYCDPTLEAGSGDPSLIPRIGYRPWRVLRDAGVTDRAAVAALDYPTASLGTAVDLNKWHADATEAAPDAPIETLRPRAHKQIETLQAAGIASASDLLDRIHTPTLETNGAGFVPEAILNARAALGPEPVYRRPNGDLPAVPRADVEIDIDMENVLDGVYLWGALVTDRTGTGIAETGYRAFATWETLTTATELENFQQFWDWLEDLIADCSTAGASVRAYCWHESAENTQLRRIARPSPALKSRVDSFIESGTWVDLERTFKHGWITGGSTSLKAVAPLAEFDWDVADPGGAMSMVHYLEATAGNANARTWLVDYNRGDVEATLAIREWLTRNGHQWPEVATALPS